MTLLDGFDEYQLVVQDWVDQLGAAGNADRRRAMDEARCRLVAALAAADRDAAIVAAAREWRRAYGSVDDGDGRWGLDTRLALAAAIDAAAVGADAPRYRRPRAGTGAERGEWRGGGVGSARDH